MGWGAAPALRQEVAPAPADLTELRAADRLHKTAPPIAVRSRAHRRIIRLRAPLRTARAAAAARLAAAPAPAGPNSFQLHFTKTPRSRPGRFRILSEHEANPSLGCLNDSATDSNDRLNITTCAPSKVPTAQNAVETMIKAIVMKKFLVPSLLMLFAAGWGQQQAKAGSFSIGISIGDDHRHHTPPVVVAAPPVLISRPPVVCAPPPVVVVQPRRDDCDRGYAYVRECERYPVHY